MADEFASLRNVSVQDEDIVRRDVAAAIVAQSSSAAQQDKLQVANAWREFEAAERRVNHLERCTQDAVRDAAVRAAVGVQPQNTGSDQEHERTAWNMEDLKYQLNVAKRHLEKKEQSLHRLQVEVERRQQKRLQDAKADEERARQRELMETARPIAPTRSAASGDRGNGIASTSCPPSSPRAPIVELVNESMLPPRTLSRRRVGAPAPASAGPPRRIGRPLEHLNGVTMEAYRGGEVLPAVNRVYVTRADIKAKHLRYTDDSDEAAFAARQLKRHKLDMASAILQREASDAKQRKGRAVVKAEGHDCVPESAAPLTEPLSVKPEEDQRSPTTAIISSDAEIIDVDALMEEEDGANSYIQGLLLKAEGGSRDTSVLPREEAPIQRPRNSRQSSVGSLGHHGDEDIAALERAYTALNIPPEPLVSLLPGISIAKSIYGRLLDYQQDGLNWLLHLHAKRCGGILGDEMGLGKTIQVAAMLNALHSSHQLRGPVIIVCPMTVLRQWVAELHRWSPHMRVCMMHESSNSTQSREALMDSVRGTPAIVMTTYAALRLHTSLIESAGPQYLILDEGHKICNPEAGVTLAAKSFATPHRLILSGSPIQNALRELWCLFDFVKPGLLGTLNKFMEEFQHPISQSKNIRATPLALATAVECAKALQQAIAPYLLRRLKRHVSTILPCKYERVIRVPLGDEQLDQYIDVVSSPAVQKLIGQTLYHSQLYGTLDRDGRDATGCMHVAGRSFNLSNSARQNKAGIRLDAYRVLHQLRQICNHADIFKVRRGVDDEDRLQLLPSEKKPSRGSGRCFRSNHPVNLLGSSKLQVLLEMMNEWHRFKHRALVFSQTRMVLDVIENLCEQEGFRYIRMDGTTNSHHRQELMDRFNEDDSIFVALLTTRVGGIGVNLVGADRVVIYDPDWNPVSDLQARERAWRIGQTRDVCIYRLITSGTVEETVLRRQLAKMYVADKVLKDPNIQRFFHQQESLVESFFLGAEYDARVPVGKKHVMVALEVGPMAGGLADDPGGEQEIARDDVSTSSPTGVTPSCSTALPVRPAFHEGAEHSPHPDAEVMPQDTTGLRSTDDGITVEREFGSLVAVTTAEEGAPACEAGNSPAGDDAETNLLRRLLDGRDVLLTGSDSVALRLARARAQQNMLRLSSQTTQAALVEQRQQRSLTYAAAQHAAREAAERAEQGRWYSEE